MICRAWFESINLPIPSILRPEAENESKNLIYEEERFPPRFSFRTSSCTSTSSPVRDADAHCAHAELDRVADRRAVDPLPEYHRPTSAPATLPTAEAAPVATMFTVPITDALGVAPGEAAAAPTVTNSAEQHATHVVAIGNVILNHT